MFCSEMLSNPPRVRGLIECCVSEANGERLDCTRSVALHEGDNRRRVDTAGQKGSNRNISNHTSCYRLGEDVFEPISDFLNR
jgi:hypothetical protein